MCALVLCLAGGLVFLLTGCGSAGTSSQREQSAANGADTQSTLTSARSLFSVLSSARTSDDMLPSVQRSPGGPLVVGSGLSTNAASVSAARRVSSTVPAWLVPESDERLCLLYTVNALMLGPGGRPLPPAVVQQCTTVAAATAGRLVVTQSLSPSSRAGSRSILVIGVVPDGVRSVSVISGDGHQTVASARRNSYASTVVDPTAVKFSDRVDKGTVSRQIPIASFDSH